MTSPPMTGNRLVAYNLRALRTARGLTQDQASALLAPYVEVPWSRATFSAAERSADSDRVRGFTADDLLALSLAFRVPVSYWFLPPNTEERRRPLMAASATVEWDDLVVGPVLGRESWQESVRPRLEREPAVVPPDLAHRADQLVRIALAERYGSTAQAANLLEETIALLRSLGEEAQRAPGYEEIRRQLAEAGIDDGEPQQ
ncbi:MAG: hypothetical protein M3Q22_10860 [Actinomycetota bacterium]|nr:hypothetical protein [Actinomycetota bacterium]